MGDTNDDLIARCREQAERPEYSAWANLFKVPALIAALEAAQDTLRAWAIERDDLRGLLDEARAEIERLRAIADIEKATSFKLRQELSDTLAEIVESEAFIESAWSLCARCGALHGHPETGSEAKAERDRLREKLQAAQVEIERLREAMSWLDECEVCKQAFWKEDGWPEADGVPMRTWVMCGGCANQRHFENQAEIERLRAAILDIDAHAYATGEDEHGFVSGEYRVSIGSLHRALGVIGHPAPPCSDEYPSCPEAKSLREKVKQGDALAAALRECWAKDHGLRCGSSHACESVTDDGSGWVCDYPPPAALAAWEDTPGGDG